MTRSTAREIAVHCSFAMGFSSDDGDGLPEALLSQEAFRRLGEEELLYSEYPNEKQLAYIIALVKGVAGHAAELDGYIARYAVGWSFSRISRMASAIMRVCMYEILYMPDVPNASAINAAVEIAKGYEEPQAVSFINGILGSFVRAEFPDQAAPKPVKAESAPEAQPEQADAPPVQPEETARVESSEPEAPPSKPEAPAAPKAPAP